MKLFMKYLGQHKWKTFFALAMKFTGSLTDLLIPVILATLIDEIALQKDVALTFQWGGYMLIVAFITFALNFSANYISAMISSAVGYSIRRDLLAKSVYLSASQIDDVTIASLETRLTSDTYNIQQVISTMLRMGVRAPVLLLGAVIISFALDPVLAIIITLSMPVIMIVVSIISKKGIGLYTSVQKNEDNMAGCVRENVLGIRVIKALGAKFFETEKFSKINDDLTDSDIKAASNMVITNPLCNAILNFASVAVLFVGAYRVAAGKCDVGVLLAFVTYFTIILSALMNISRIFIMTTKGLASGDRIQSVLDLKSTLSISEAAKKEDVPYICFDDVSFAYSGFSSKRKSMNIKNVSFGLEKGQTLGILGATGSGKSTLLLLLMRFYDANSGNIYIDGENVKSIPLETLHKKFGVALQSDYLFSDTILENICFGRELDIKEVDKSVEVAQAKNFIGNYKEGYDFKLAIKGSNLSGGQKQRLLIARAVASNPDILILDDSSSALDYKTDSMLRSELSKIESDTTTILVAQRISSVKDADVIIILSEGQIVDIGNHDELINRCEIYKELSAHQLGVINS